MSALNQVSVPVLSSSGAREQEQQLFGGEEAREWRAMEAAGAGIALAAIADYREIGGFPSTGRVLVLAGKGHNGGDALIAARGILREFPAATADVLFVFGERTLRPLSARAWRELQQAFAGRVSVIRNERMTDKYELCLDGIFGFQYRPPVEPRIQALIARVNDLPIRFRAAVDLPSAGLFRADFTYATGSVKEPVLDMENAGRVRFVDLGFFSAEKRAVRRDGTVAKDQSQDEPASAVPDDASSDRVLTLAVLEPLRALRPPRSDKRSYGHVFILGGSRGFPGAVLMSAMAALRSGAGLVTVFVPESLAPGFAARLPEAIWVGWPETPAGSLALEGEHLLRERVERADALVIGPGAGREPETLALLQSVVTTSGIPVAIDADALQRDIVLAGTASRVITPHAGEFKRIAGGSTLLEFARDPKLTVVLKGPITRLCQGGGVYNSLFGGPVLARGGSGDLLAGMIGTQLAQTPEVPLDAAARAVVWHGHAADLLARANGQIAVATTQLLDHLEPALRIS